MADSTSPIDQIVEGTGAVRMANENFDAGSNTMTGGRRASGITGLLKFAVYGGRVGGVVGSNTEVTLTASSTNYIVRKKSDGVVSTATGTTNWDDSTNYWRLYSVVTNTTAVTSYSDERLSATGLFGLAGASTPGGSTSQIQYNNAGALSGSANFTWDNANNRVNTVNLTATGLILTAASASGGAGFRVPHGAAPSAPVDGDLWSTTSGLFARINGATVGPFASSAGSLTNPMTAVGDIIAGSTVVGGFATPARLAIGTNTTDVLGVTAGTPAWVKRTPLIIPIACSDETTALSTGTAKVTFRMPCAMTLTDVRASVTTAATGGTLLTVDVNESGATILSTKLTFDASEKTTTTAATPRVISDSSLADDAEITIDIDAVGSTITGAGLKVYLIGYAA
jgi:hypothetical protein